MPSNDQRLLLQLLLLLPLSSVSAFEVDKQATDIIECRTSVKHAGSNFTLELYHGWAPQGVKRVLALAEHGFLDGLPFFRALPNFLIQFGIQPDAIKQRYWQDQGNIPDDPSKGIAFTDGVVSFAGYSRNSRSTHLFITLGNQPGLGRRPWEVAIGKVTRGMDVVRNIYSGYGDKVDQGRLQAADSEHYIQSEFPLLDRIEACTVRRAPSGLDERAAQAAALEAAVGQAGDDDQEKLNREDVEENEEEVQQMEEDEDEDEDELVGQASIGEEEGDFGGEGEMYEGEAALGEMEREALEEGNYEAAMDEAAVDEAAVDEAAVAGGGGDGGESATQRAD